MPYQEVEKFLGSKEICDFMEQELAESWQFRTEYQTKMKPSTKSAEQPWEFCRQGILKHVIHEKLNTREMCVDIYQQLIPGGSRSGQHRHMTEEVLYVLEGKGYDLHYDVVFNCDKQYLFEWTEEPVKYEWEEGDFIYIPPYVVHQHFNADPKKPVRLISASNRLVKAMGMGWIDQLASCPEYPDFTGWKEKILK